jgi:hypothetical protein
MTNTFAVTDTVAQPRVITALQSDGFDACAVLRGTRPAVTVPGTT